MDGAATIVLNKDKEILLVKRRDIPIWVIPGGGIEKDETPNQAAIRETKEESGFDVSITRSIARYTYGNNQKNIICLKQQLLAVNPQQAASLKRLLFSI